MGALNRSLCTALLVCGAGPALADTDRWTVERDAVDATGEARPVAVIGAASGDRLRVYRDGEERVQLSVRLRAGFERLDSAVCPTVQVDGDPPRTPAVREDCRMDSRGAEITLGNLRDGTIDSPLLARLMTGTAITWRFRLLGVGYRQIRFSLRGSMQALVQITGSRVRGVPGG